MTNKEKRRLIKDWAAALKNFDAACEKAKQGTGINHCETLQGTSASQVCDAYTTALESCLGISDNWLGWFAWENNFGKSGFEVKINNESIKVETLDDLFMVIEI